MSRVIKSAVLHDQPKLVETLVLHSQFAQGEEDAPEKPDASAEEPQRSEAEQIRENALAEANQHRQSVEAECAALLEAQRRKAETLTAEAARQSESVLAKTKQQSDELLEQARAEAESLRQTAKDEGAAQGREEGYKAGYEEGMQAGQAKMQEAIQSANEKAARTLAVAEEEAKAVLLQCEKNMMEIVLEIANKVIPQHFIDAPQLILPLVKKALEKVKDQNSILIRVSPDNYEFVLLAKNELQLLVEGDEKLTITADPLLENHDCVIESANGNVDARLETQMEAVKKAVQEVMQ